MGNWEDGVRRSQAGETGGCLRKVARNMILWAPLCVIRPGIEYLQGGSLTTKSTCHFVALLSLLSLSGP